MRISTPNTTIYVAKATLLRTAAAFAILCASAALPAWACETVDGIMCAIPTYDFPTGTAASARSEMLGRAMAAAAKLNAEKKFAAAKAKLKPVLALEEKTPQEIAAIQDLVAVVSYGLKDYAAAAVAFDAALASGGVPATEAPRRLAALTQLYAQIGNHAKTIAAGTQYIAVEGPDADISVLIGRAHYIGKNFGPATQAFRAAIAAARAQNVAVKEEWIQLLISGEYQIRNTEGTLAALELLVEKYPRPEHWQDLLRMAGFVYKDSATLDAYRSRFAHWTTAQGGNHLETVVQPQQVVSATP